MKQDMADRGKLDCRASKYRSGSDQTNYKAMQNIQLRASLETLHEQDSARTQVQDGDRQR